MLNNGGINEYAVDSVLWQQVLSHVLIQMSQHSHTILSHEWENLSK